MSFFTARNKRFIKLGIPFFALVVGGSLTLRQFSQVRYDHRAQKTLDREEMAELGVTMKAASDVTIEKQFKRLKEMDIDTWENKRGPRPWEETDGSTTHTN